MTPTNSRLSNSLLSNSRPSRRRPPSHPRPAAETLEPRRLFVGGLFSQTLAPTVLRSSDAATAYTAVPTPDPTRTAVFYIAGGALVRAVYDAGLNLVSGPTSLATAPAGYSFVPTARPAVAYRPDGSFFAVVTGQSSTDNADGLVYTFNASGSRLANGLNLTDDPTDLQTSFTVVPTSTGFAAAWTNAPLPGAPLSDTTLSFARFNPDGTRTASPLQVYFFTSSTPAGGAFQDLDPVLVPQPDDTVLIYSRRRELNPDGSLATAGQSIFSRRIPANNNLVGSSIGVVYHETVTTTDLASPQVFVNPTLSFAGGTPSATGAPYFVLTRQTPAGATSSTLRLIPSSINGLGTGGVVLDTTTGANNLFSLLSSSPAATPYFSPQILTATDPRLVVPVFTGPDIRQASANPLTLRLYSVSLTDLSASLDASFPAALANAPLSVASTFSYNTPLDTLSLRLFGDPTVGGTFGFGSLTASTYTAVTPAPATLSVADIVVATNTATASFTLTASSPVVSDVTVLVSTLDGSPSTTATPGTEYASTSATVTIPAGQTSATFSFPVTLFRRAASQTVQISVTQPTGPAVFAGSAPSLTALATLTGTASTPPSNPGTSVTLSVADVTVAPGASTAQIFFTASAPVSAPVTFTVSLDNTPFLPSAQRPVPGVNYNPLPPNFTVTLSPGDDTAVVSLTGLANPRSADLALRVVASGLSGPATFSDNSATVVIPAATTDPAAGAEVTLIATLPDSAATTPLRPGQSVSIQFTAARTAASGNLPTRAFRALLRLTLTNATTGLRINLPPIPLSLSLSANRPTTRTVAFTLPSPLLTDEFLLGVSLAPSPAPLPRGGIGAASAFAGARFGGGPVAPQVLLPVANQLGSGASFFVADPQGNLALALLTGPGTASFTTTAAGLALVLSGVSPATTFTLRSLPGVVFNLASVDVSGYLGRFLAASTNLLTTGNFTGGVGNLTLRSVGTSASATNARLTLGSAPLAARVAINNLFNATLLASQVLSGFTTRDWIDDAGERDTFTAPAIRFFSARNYQPDTAVSGAFGNATVSGTLGNDAGSRTVITAATFAAWNANIVRNTTLLAGTTSTAVPTTRADFTPGSFFSSFTIARTGAFSNSIVAARRFGTISLTGVSADPNLPAYGIIVGEQIRSYTRGTFRRSNLTALAATPVLDPFSRFAITFLF